MSPLQREALKLDPVPVSKPWGGEKLLPYLLPVLSPFFLWENFGLFLQLEITVDTQESTQECTMDCYSLT